MGRVEFRGVDCQLEVGELERDEERSATRNRDNTVASSRGERERGEERWNYDVPCGSSLITGSTKPPIVLCLRRRPLSGAWDFPFCLPN